MKPWDKKAIVLIAAVMLIIFTSIAVLGVTVFIVQRLSQKETDRRNTTCLYLAQAGFNNAVYFFRYNLWQRGRGFFSSGTTTIDVDNSFVMFGTQADLLMVNTQDARFAGNPRRDLQITNALQKAVDNKVVIIDRMIVSWTNSARLFSIRIAGSDVWSNPSGSPPPQADCNINDFTLGLTAQGLPRIYGINRIRFEGDMSGVSEVSIVFVMKDGSQRAVLVYPASLQKNFIVKSQGKTTGSSIFRTIEAEYNSLTSSIIRYQEIGTTAP